MSIKTKKQTVEDIREEVSIPVIDFQKKAVKNAMAQLYSARQGLSFYFNRIYNDKNKNYEKSNKALTNAISALSDLMGELLNNE